MALDPPGAAPARDWPASLVQSWNHLASRSGSLSSTIHPDRLDEPARELPSLKLQAGRIKARLVPDGKERSATAISRVVG